MEAQHGQQIGLQDALQSEAFIRGRRDGGAMVSPSLNPYLAGSAEHEQWRLGRESAANDAAAYANAAIKREQVEPLLQYRDRVDRDLIGRRVA